MLGGIRHFMTSAVRVAVNNGGVNGRQGLGHAAQRLSNTSAQPLTNSSQNGIGGLGGNHNGGKGSGPIQTALSSYVAKRGQ